MSRGEAWRPLKQAGRRLPNDRQPGGVEV